MMRRKPISSLSALLIITLCSGCATTSNETPIAPKDQLEFFKELVVKNPSLSSWTVDQWNPGTTDSSVVQRKLTCTARNNEGRCVSATCEADEVSDCATWIFWCWWYGYVSTGDAQSATCTDVERFPCC